MERSKASFLLPVLVVGALVLILAGARKPGTGDTGSGALSGVRGVAAKGSGEGDSGDTMKVAAKGSGEEALSGGGERVADLGENGERVTALGENGVRRAALGENGTRGAEASEAGPGAEAISWMTIEQAAGKLKEVGRPLIIDLYTTWCGWCKQMDRKTYSNKQVAAYLKEKFYTVKMDAESPATINWAGKTYNFNSQYRANEFALYLTHGRLEFPTTIFIVPGEEPQAIPGYMEPKELEILVKYFGEGDYRTKSFDDYQKKFRTSW